MLQALQFLVLIFAGWLNRHQEDLIDYLREENRVLREQIGTRPLRLTDVQRRRLAVRGKALGRRALTRVDLDRGAPQDFFVVLELFVPAFRSPEELLKKPL